MNTTPTISNASTALAEALGLDVPLDSPGMAAYPSKPLIARPIQSNDIIPGDADYARQNIYDIIENGAKAIEVAQNLFYESQHPRAGEILGQLLKVQSDNVDKLMKLHGDVKKLKDNVATPQTINGNVNIQAVFQGTTTQLLDMIRNEQKNVLELDAKDIEQ